GPCTSLLVEACLLNTQIAASLSGKTDSALQPALQALLEGKPQSLWTIVAGQAPSPVEVNWWGPGNPRLPRVLQWTVTFAPLPPTQTDAAPVGYTQEFFTANFTVDPQTGSFVSYTPDGGNGSISVDPAKIAFPQAQAWTGQSILSGTAVANLARSITNYIAKEPDSTLRTILGQLNATPTLVQPLSGFTASLLVQLQIAVPQGPPFQPTYLTKETRSVVGPFYHVSPKFGWYYNPIRAGWFTVSLQAVDVFGQKRPIALDSIAQAESVTAYSQKQP